MFKGFCCFPCFETLFVFKGFYCFPCFWTLFVFKGFCCFAWYWTLQLFKSVWKQEKRPNPLKKWLLSRDFVISPVYRHFLDSKVSRKRENSKILWTRKMSRNRENSKILLIQKTWITRGTNRPFRCLEGILLFSLFLDTFCIQGILLFLLYRHFLHSKVSGNRKKTKSLEKKLLFSRDFVVSVYRHFSFSKVSGNRKKGQILWKNHYF